MPWSLVFGLVGLGLLLGGEIYWFAFRSRKPRYAWPELEELSDRVSQLERRQKLIQGRLNSIAPPREGTGSAVAAGVPPDGAETPQRPLSRSALLAHVMRRQNARDE